MRGWTLSFWFWGAPEGSFFFHKLFHASCQTHPLTKVQTSRVHFFQETLGAWYWIDIIYLCWYYSRNLSFVRNFHLFLRWKSTIIWPRFVPSRTGDLAGRSSITGCGSSNISWDFRSLGILYRPWPQPMGNQLKLWGDSIFNTLDGRHRANQLRLIVYAIIYVGLYTSQVVVWDFFHRQ